MNSSLMLIGIHLASIIVLGLMLMQWISTARNRKQLFDDLHGTELQRGRWIHRLIVPLYALTTLAIVIVSSFFYSFL